MKLQQSTKQVMMTEGVIWKQLMAFSMPLLLGNLCQQLYSTVDAVVVGRFVGSEALAAVSSSNSLINLIIGMFIGIATGAGVLISQYYGAREEEKMGWVVHTSMALSIWGGLILSGVGIVISPYILTWMKTPPEVLSNSVIYFRIYFSGSLFNLVYNMGAGILRAVGDSKRPLYYLCAASITNVVLDLLFVLVFPMGIAGVAYATVLSQLLSAVLVIRALMKTEDIYRLSFKELKIDKRMMGRVLTLGIPSGLQQSIISFSNVIVQTNINSFGKVAMAGFGAYTKIDGFAMLPIQSFCLAATTFTGQNVGAGRVDRVKEGMKQGMIITFIYTIAISLVLYVAAEPVLGIFSDELEVIRYGKVTMVILMPFYLTLAVHQILMGTLRGAGKTTATMLISVGNMCVLRMIYINLLVPFFPSYEAVMWGYPITWCTTALMEGYYTWKVKWVPDC